MRGPVYARYATAPNFSTQRRTAAQLAGLRFEAHIIQKLTEQFAKVEAGPWLYYRADRCSGICQPDALVWIQPNHICLVEVKLTWQKPARQKLLEFYGPVVQALYPDAKLSYLQVYKNWKSGCHKRVIKLDDLSQIKEGTYKECHHLPH